MADDVTQAAPVETATPDDWRAGIEEGRLREFAARFATPGDAVKTAFELRQKLSVASPFGDGVPEAPEGYRFTLPGGGEAGESDRAFHDRMGRLFHAAGVSGRQAETLNQGWNAMLDEARAVQEAADARAADEAEAMLRHAWGPDYDRNRALAERAVARFHDGDAQEILNVPLADGRLLGSHPAFVRYAAAVGAQLAEDTLHDGTPSSAAGSAQERIDEIHGWQHADDPALRARYRAADVQDELAALYRSLHGDAPVVGAEGRVA